MAIHYQYKVYENYPEASEISETRERHAVCLTSLAGLGIIATVICLIVDFVEMWPMIFFGIICVLGLVYLCTYYPEVTEKKIRKAIEKRDKMEREIRGSKYSCKYIKQIAQGTIGKCMVCGTTDVRTLCKIKNDIGTRELQICTQCLRKFESNLK